MLELLSPVGDFECLKAAVQNGADTVYFGANLFSARAFAKNFNLDELKQAIEYAKLRNVKTNLTLNTLIKNNEFKDAFSLAQKAYELGIDAIIVQDLGLAKKLIEAFPDLPIHASTQITAHNLDGVLQLQNMGFKRVVLSRELSIKEIEHICKNSNVEIECFIHGALCISYSGQCLFSSMVGGRSGNRGKCAQPCRLPYTLIENTNSIDNGYLLSPRDLCGLEYIPHLVNTGISCLKIEGRMKTPEYVATVTRIYRKYIDLAKSNQEYIIDPQDKKDLLQVFNRGEFSNGHLNNEANKKLIFKEKSNNMGIYLGEVINHNNKKGYVDLKLQDDLSIGDRIFIDSKLKDKNDFNYTISEILIKNTNINSAKKGNNVTIGRIKGNINNGAKIYKMSSKALLINSKNSYENVEHKKRLLNCTLDVHLEKPIKICVYDANIKIELESNILPVTANSSPITKERLTSQLSKTNNTAFEFKNIQINLDDNLYVPSISSINELRRNSLKLYEEKFNNSIKRKNNTQKNIIFYNSKNNNILKSNKTITVLLNTLHDEFDYLALNNINKIYIPLKFFLNSKYYEIISKISSTFDTYIYMPTIMRNNYILSFNKKINTILEKFKIKGFVISNIGQLSLLEKYKNSFTFIGNYTLNIFNSFSANTLDLDEITLSPELNKPDLEDLLTTTKNINTELIVYGNLPLMNSNYCLLGKSNKCYTSCDKKCLSNSTFYIKDRMGFLFRLIPDNIDTVTTIYNSKVTSIPSFECGYSSARIDIIDEEIDEINHIVNEVKLGKKLEGKIYTNGNYNRI